MTAATITMIEILIKAGFRAFEIYTSAKEISGMEEEEVTKRIAEAKKKLDAEMERLNQH